MLRGGGAASRPTAIPEVDRHPRPSDKGLFAPSPAEGEAVQKGRPSQSTCGSRLTSRSRSFHSPSPPPRFGIASTTITAPVLGFSGEAVCTEHVRD